MSQIVIVNSGTVNDVERFRALADQAISLVESELPGTVQYECYLDPDSSRFVWHESYTDSAAVLAHVQRLMEAGLPQQLPELVDAWDFVLALGDPDAEAREALDQMGFTVMPLHAEASR